jgi:hypothetical protein
MSPNWRENGAMSIQKLMVGGAELHLQQSEEIIRLRRNVSSLAKKNHQLMRQVHELVTKLQQYPPPRIPEETRPSNQADSDGRPSSHPSSSTYDIGDSKSDSRMHSAFEQETSHEYPCFKIERENTEMEDARNPTTPALEAIILPSPPATIPANMPIQQRQQQPTPAETPAAPESISPPKAKLENRSDRTPPTSRANTDHSTPVQTLNPSPKPKIMVVVTVNATMIDEIIKGYDEYQKGQQLQYPRPFSGERVHMHLETWAWHCYSKNLAVLITSQDNWTHAATNSDITEGWVCLGKIENKTGKHRIQGKEVFVESPLVQDGYMFGPRVGERRPLTHIKLVEADEIVY